MAFSLYIYVSRGDNVLPFNARFCPVCENRHRRRLVEVGIYTRERVYYSIEYWWNFNQWEFYCLLMGDKDSECGAKKLKIGIILLTAITGQQMIPFRK